jgi:hypothetical protein
VRESLPGSVMAAVAALPAEPPDSERLFEHMVTWVRASSPTGIGAT